LNRNALIKMKNMTRSLKYQRVISEAKVLIILVQYMDSITPQSRLI